MNRKFPCTPKSHEIPQHAAKKTEFICNYCNHSFTRKDSLSRHIKDFCQIKKDTDNDKEKLFQKLLQEHEKLISDHETMKQEIQNLKKENKKYKQIIHKQTNNTHNNTHNTLNNTQNINIKNSDLHFNIVAFGNEDISFITDDTFKKILNKGFKSIPALVDELHFNKNKPENHNIYISNLRDDYVLVFDGNDWNLKSRKDVLDTLYYSNSDTLEMKFKELVDSLDKFTIRKFERFLDQKDDDVVINDIKKDLKILLYNRRKTVADTRKLISS
jgi:hypothetical protein